MVEVDRTMVTISLKYDGELRCKATHKPSGKTLGTDAPADNHGRGETFSPTDLVATALISCMMTIIAIQAEQDGYSLKGSTATVNKFMTTVGPRRIGKLDVKLRLPSAIPPERRGEFETAARACPVMRSLNSLIDIPIDFDWTA